MQILDRRTTAEENYDSGMNHPEMMNTSKVDDRQVDFRGLSERELRLLRELQTRSLLDLGDLREQVSEARSLIDAGLAKLTIVQRPWGLEFLLQRVSC